MTSWLHRFRKLDVRQKEHRKMLIDTFINAIFLYDDKLVITFNYKEGTKTITFADLQDAINNNTGSDLDCLGAAGLEPIVGKDCKATGRPRYEREKPLKVFLLAFMEQGYPSLV